MRTVASPTRVALADDDAQMRAVLLVILRDLGAEVTAAVDGAGLRALLSPGHRFDVVVSDVIMPRFTGPAVGAELRARGDMTPIIFVTGSGHAADPVIRSLSNVVVLRKPFSTDAFEEAYAAMTAPMHAGRPEVHPAVHR